MFIASLSLYVKKSFCLILDLVTVNFVVLVEALQSHFCLISRLCCFMMHSKYRKYSNICHCCTNYIDSTRSSHCITVGLRTRQQYINQISQYILPCAFMCASFLYGYKLHQKLPASMINSRRDTFFVQLCDQL